MFLLIASSIAISVFLFSAVANTNFISRQTDVYFEKLKTMRPVPVAKTVLRKYPTILDFNKNRTQSDPWIKNKITVDWHQYFTKRRGYNDFVKYYHHRPLSQFVFEFLETIHRGSYRKPWVYFSWNPFYLVWLFPLSLLLFRIFPMSAIFSCIVLSQVVLLLAVIGTVNYRYYYFLLLSSYFLVPLAVLDLKLRKER